MTYWKDKVAVITGGSAGFGRELAQAFVQQGARVALVARDAARLEATREELGELAHPFVADVTQDSDVEQLVQQVTSQLGRVDALVNCVGKSTRGAVLDTTPDDFRQLFELNFLTAVRCTRVFAAALKETNGHIVNIGSLAAKSASRFIGAYPASKFPLAAYSQQLRLEINENASGAGVHVLLVCPGPIARPDAGERYEEMKGVPAAARKPGGGVKLKGIDPAYLSRRVLRACEQRKLELIVPAKARALFLISQLSASWGDWLVKKMTR